MYWTRHRSTHKKTDNASTTKSMQSIKDMNLIFFDDDQLDPVNTNLNTMAKEIVYDMTEDQQLWLKYHYNLKNLPKA